MKSFLVSARTQFATHRKENVWHFFRRIDARTKGEAVEQARRENRNHMIYSGLGLVWFRATEAEHEIDQKARAEHL
jgi:hypothetical protein